MAMTALCVPYSPDSGKGNFSRVSTSQHSSARVSTAMAPSPQHSGIETHIIHELSSRKFTAHNNLY